MSIALYVAPGERRLSKREQRGLETPAPTRQCIFDPRRGFGVSVPSQDTCRFQTLQSIGQSPCTYRRQRRDELGRSHRPAKKGHDHLQRPSVSDDAEKLFQRAVANRSHRGAFYERYRRLSTRTPGGARS